MVSSDQAGSRNPGYDMKDFDLAQVDAIINARSIAIVGASNNPGKFGGLLIASLLAMGFTGEMYFVNPGETKIMGRPAYPDLTSLPAIPDLVYITIPAHRSMEILRECAKLNARPRASGSEADAVKAVIVIAAGFREAGEEGRRMEEEAVSLSAEAGFRIIGPNCFGIYNPRNRLTLLPSYDLSRELGDIGFMAQSGGFAGQLARMGKSLGLGFSAVVSYGNGGDLDEVDLLRYFAADPQTSYIAAYLEGVRDGEAFRQALCEAAAAKPVVIWKVGRAESSRRAVASHTGSLAGSADIWEALLHQCGAIPASGVDEVLDILLALKLVGPTPGKRLGIAGGGGGLGTYAADLAEAEGLQVPLPDPETLAAMREALTRAGAVPGNPLDIGAPLIPLPEFEGAIRAAAYDPATDIFVFDLAINFGYDIAGETGLHLAMDALIRAKEDSGKPVVAVIYSRNEDSDELTLEKERRRVRDKLIAANIPVYPSMARALRALARIN